MSRLRRFGIGMGMAALAMLVLRMDVLPAAIVLEPVAGGFEFPIGVVPGPDGNSLYVLEQRGAVWRIETRGHGRRKLLDLRGQLAGGFEQGLLGLAFHPDHMTNGRLFVSYTATDDAVVIDEYRSSGPEGLDYTDTILRVAQPHEFHNGGHIMFGPDGYLWIGLGDGGDDLDRNGHGQDPRTLLGALLRVDVDGDADVDGDGDGDPDYRTPRDNPFASGRAGAPEVYAYGLRNPWRFSFDSATGDLWIGDVGRAQFEEVNLLRADSDGAANFGWSDLEGNQCFRSDPCPRENRRAPVATYPRDNGDCAVIGGIAYRGRELSGLRDQYLFGDYCSGRVRALDLGNPGSARIVAELPVQITSFAADEFGRLYLVDHGGTIYRVASGPAR